MTPEAILEALKLCGARVEAVGDKLRCRAPVGVLTPDLRQAIAEQKAALLQLLTTPAPSARSVPDDHHDRLEPPCSICGGTDWRNIPDAGRWCVPCVVAGREPVAAVKVQSPVLDTAIWVVCDDLPREQWPQDGAAVYTQSEVKILTHVGQDTLAWVHPVKELFDARVVGGRPRPSAPPADAPGEEDPDHG